MDEQDRIKALKAMAESYLSAKNVLNDLNNNQRDIDHLSPEEKEKLINTFTGIKERKLNLLIRYITTIL